MMRVLLVKEARENLRWAGLLMLAMAAALAYTAHGDAEASGVLLVGTGMTATTVIAFPVIGLALGLLQVLQDRRPGRWGFVTHRPTSRSAIFGAKLVAGVGLYLLAAAVPLGVTVAWLATPGHAAGPFEGRMVLPVLADLTSGLLWYATGLLIAARPARWVGTRLMPVGFALLLTAYAWVWPFHLWLAEAMLAAGMAVVLPAAWAAFVAGDGYFRQPLLARGLQVVAVGPGVTLAVGLVAALLSGTIEWAHPSADLTSYEYSIDADGRVLRYRGTRFGTTTVTDLAGRPVVGVVKSLAVGSVWPVPFLSDASPWANRRDTQALHAAGAYVRPVVTSGNVRWFYVVRRRTIEGYDRRTGRLVGSLGRNGFVPPSRPPQPFTGDLYHGLSAVDNVLADPAGVYRVTRSGELQIVYRATADDPVIAPSASFAEDRAYGPTYTAVVTLSGIHILADDRPVCVLPLDRTGPRHNGFEVGRMRDGQFVVFYRDGWDGNSSVPGLVVTATADGRVVSRTKLPVLPPMVQVEPWWSEALSMVAVPPFLLGLLRLVGENTITRFDVGVVVGAGAMAVAAVAVIAWRWALGRRAGVGWAAFAAVTGLGGLLTLLAVRPLAARVACPTCGRRRVVTREACEHCGAPFPAPVAEGIEVFEAA